MRDRSRPFSLGWTLVSCVVFVATELVLGRLLAPMVVGRYKSMQTEFLLQGSLNLASYLAGGFLVGVVSPGVRLGEPAIGAAFSILLVQVLTIFTPYGFVHFETHKLLVGGVIAFALALTGAWSGERLMGNLGD